MYEDDFITAQLEASLIRDIKSKSNDKKNV